MVNQIQREALTREDLYDSTVSSAPGKGIRKGIPRASKNATSTCLRTQNDLRSLAERAKGAMRSSGERKGADLRVEESPRKTVLRHKGAARGSADSSRCRRGQCPTTVLAITIGCVLVAILLALVM